jgi:hypothetical protein
VREKIVTLKLKRGIGRFFTEGTDVVRDLPFESAELIIEGEGFKIHCFLNSLNKQKGEFRVDTGIEYLEKIE